VGGNRRAGSPGGLRKKSLSSSAPGPSWQGGPLRLEQRGHSFLPSGSESASQPTHGAPRPLPPTKMLSFREMGTPSLAWERRAVSSPLPHPPTPLARRSSVSRLASWLPPPLVPQAAARWRRSRRSAQGSPVNVRDLVQASCTCCFSHLGHFPRYHVVPPSFRPLLKCHLRGAVPDHCSHFLLVFYNRLDICSVVRAGPKAWWAPSPVFPPKTLVAFGSEAHK
jgi:hypothetical protein